MWKLDKDRNAAIQSVYSKNLDYVREGYYNYPILSNCWGFDKIELKYTRNHMHLLILPHGIKIKRRVHKWDKTVYPNSRRLINSLKYRNGNDLAYVLNQLDRTEMLPYQSILRYAYGKIVDVFKKIF